MYCKHCKETTFYLDNGRCRNCRNEALRAATVQLDADDDYCEDCGYLESRCECDPGCGSRQTNS